MFWVFKKSQPQQGAMNGAITPGFDLHILGYMFYIPDAQCMVYLPTFTP